MTNDYDDMSLSKLYTLIDKLRAENAELKTAISPDELLPMRLMNARLIEENEELRKLVYKAYFCHITVKVWEDNWRVWSAQHPILKGQL